MLTAMLALVVWTFVIWFWMYLTRIPAMRRNRIDARVIKRKDDLDSLPVRVKQVADNYNHLHEQPTIFFALVSYCHFAGTADVSNVRLAWTYVALRVVHSISQCTSNFVPFRFTVFALSSVVLMVIAGRNVAALF